ncbi:MAG: sugar phosphate isomerase/epimerase [Bdellovibrionaceae bacterium]|nr:sugar phosphate isomerase/epimerase [Pseudobdellovibrionaceae bacterium]
MRLSISNLAWDPNEDECIAGILKSNKVDAIDVASGKYFPHPKQTTQTEIARVKNWWAAHAIQITGMQALLFGTTGLNVFGSKKSQEDMLNHLQEICRIGNGLGAKHLVFGSPKNRDCAGLSEAQTKDTAHDFFNKLGDIANNHNVIICLEPNPTLYGSNFMINSVETAKVVRDVNHPGIKMQLDVGAITINKEYPNVIADYVSLIGHIHASEPHLIPLGDYAGSEHELMGNLINRLLPDHTIAIEMLATKDEPHPTSIERAIRTARKFYVKEECNGE